MSHLCLLLVVLQAVPIREERQAWRWDAPSHVEPFSLAFRRVHELDTKPERMRYVDQYYNIVLVTRVCSGVRDRCTWCLLPRGRPCLWTLYSPLELHDKHTRGGAPSAPPAKLPETVRRPHYNIQRDQGFEPPLIYAILDQLLVANKGLR